MLFVFLDGVGLGDDDAESNPFVTAKLPVLDRLLDGVRPLRSTAPRTTSRATLVPLDAELGVSGTPQSGTGHAALFTGINAVERYGRHFGPWVPASLRPLLRTHSVLAAVQAAGRSVAFANAYPEELFDAQPPVAPGEPLAKTLSDAGRRVRGAPRYLQAGPPLAALGAGVLVRHTAALERGDAVASEITNEGWRDRLGRTSLPLVSPADAGMNLGRIAARHDLTLFAHYSTDYAGHAQRLDAAIQAIERVDAFLGGILDAVPADTLVCVASDHGNLEDCSTGHTRNPALGLAFGAGHEQLHGARAITDVVPALLRALGLSDA